MKKLNLIRLLATACCALCFLAVVHAMPAAAPQRRPAKRRAPAVTQPKANTPAPTQTPAASDSATVPPANTTKKNTRDAPDAAAPSPASDVDAAAASATGEGYVYEFTQPGSHVFKIKIEHDAEGRGRVTFERQIDTEPLTEDFAFSPAAFARVTKLWESLGALEREGGYQSPKQFPHMGTHTLRLTRGGRTRATEFNWTEQPEAEALAKEYRNAAEQSILAFEFAVAIENQPLETPKLLSRFERLLELKSLSDPTQMFPLLRRLSEDERVPLVARNHAGRLLKKLEKAEKAKN